jgi:outer membrane protein assembly factor BamD
MASVAEKKEERLREAYDEYFTFTNDYPEGKYAKEVKRMYDKICKKMEDYQ